MATRDQIYAKYGIVAEAAQLFETELGSLLLCAKGLENGWHINADAERARKLLNEMDRITLGQLLGRLKGCIAVDEELADRFAAALKARNRLFHGFYELHNSKIETDHGRDSMIADLELLHEELFSAWRSASAMTALATEFLLQAKHRNRFSNIDVFDD